MNKKERELFLIFERIARLRLEITKMKIDVEKLEIEKIEFLKSHKEFLTKVKEFNEYFKFEKKINPSRRDV